MAQLKNFINKHNENKEKHDALKDQLNKQHRRMSTVQNECFNTWKGRLIIKCPTIGKNIFSVSSMKKNDLTKSGSHNVVIGNSHSFPSYGGFVMG